MNNPLFSIVVPVYNAEKYLHECLDSIKDQSYTEWECILVDDGSKDNSGFICDEFTRKDSRFIVIHKENEGVSSARNTGVENSKGEWLVFIDSDDYIREDYLYDLAQCTKNKVDFIITGFTKFGGDAVIRSSRYSKGVYNSDQRSTVLQDILSNGAPWAKAYRRDIVCNNGILFDKHLSISEDRLFMYCYLPFVKKVCESDKTSYFYRCNESSITFTRRKPSEYIYRLDILAEKSLAIIESWTLLSKDVVPFIVAHCNFIKEAAEKAGIQYLLGNSMIIKEKDYYRINNASKRDRLFIYKEIGFLNILVYYKKWSLIKFYNRVKQMTAYFKKRNN